jgi:hypothetical protein
MRIGSLSAMALSGALLFSCGKKDEDKVAEVAYPEGIAPEEGESTVTKSVAIANSLVLSLEDFGDYDVDSKRLKRTKLVDYTIDTEEKWNNQETFNWFDSGNSGSATPKEFVNAALNPDQDNAPLNKMKSSMDMLCTLGALFPESELGADGMPKAREFEELEVDEDTIARIEENCNQEIGDDEEIGTFEVGVEDITSDHYSKYIKMYVGGDYPQTLNIYLGFKPTGISLLQWTEEEKEDPYVERMAFNYDPQNKLFAFEYISGVFAEEQSSKSYNHHRVAIDENTDEARVFAVMGSSLEENLTFIGLNGNFKESEVGVSFYRVGPPNVADAFICVNADDGSFVNTTGCTENDDLDRETEFNQDSEGFSSAYEIDADDWNGDETISPPSFDLDSIFSAEVEN